MSSGFKINECDKCVYVKNTDEGYIILCLYIDDIIIVGNNDKVIQSTKNMLNSKFDTKDMGLADVLTDLHYLRHTILIKFNKFDLNIARTCVDVNLHLSNNGGKGVFQLKNSHVIGV